MPKDSLYSVCPHDCPSACALEVEKVAKDRIGKVRGSKRNPYTNGIICGKVTRYAERANHPDRLLYPMVRTGPKGTRSFERVSWDEALSKVADAFLAAEQDFGAESVWPYFYAGTMGLVQRDGINRLRHAKKYALQKGTICTFASRIGWNAGVGATYGVDTREMAHSDYVIIWGSNPVSTQIQVVTQMLEAQARGGKLVVIDPYRTKTAEKADWHLPIRPGTDGALACAMMHVVLRDGLADRDYMARYTDDPAGLEDHLQTRTPAWAAAITGLAEEDIVRLAQEYGRANASFIRLGIGMSRTRNGAANIHAIACLPAVTGAWQHKGGGAFYASGGLAAAIDKTLIEGLDIRDETVRELDMTRIGHVLTNNPDDLAGGPPVKAMIVQNCNPMNVAPELNLVRQGFEREDLFVCVHEQFMTETALMADVILPATMFVEHDDVYGSYGHYFLQVAKKIVEAPGECRSNHDVITDLASRLGASHRGFGMSELDIIAESLEVSGYPDIDTIIESHGLDLSRSFEEMHFINGFPTADGKFHFRPDWANLGERGQAMPQWPDHFDVIDNSTPAKPFRMVTAPAQEFLNSSFAETDTSRRKLKQPLVHIHPGDCADLGLAQGGKAALSNEKGEVIVHVKPFEGLQRGVVVVESIWPNRAFDNGMGINSLTSADPGYPAGGAVFHDTSVAIRAL